VSEEERVMKVGDLVRTTRRDLDGLVGLVQEVLDGGNTIVVEWLPEATPLLPMIEKMPKYSVELVK